jgi:hypothetical protein
MSEDPLHYSAAPQSPQRLIPVLQVPREELRRGVRDTLFVLHQERLWRSKSADREGCLAQIAFWEAVLGWIQEQHGDSVNFVGRAH